MAFARSARPAEVTSSPAAGVLVLADSGFARSSASARFDREAEALPVVEMPVPPATARSGSDLAAPALRELFGFGLENLVAWCPTGSGSKVSAAWQASTVPEWPVRTKLVRLSSGFESRFGDYGSCRFPL